MKNEPYIVAAAFCSTGCHVVLTFRYGELENEITFPTGMLGNVIDALYEIQCELDKKKGGR